MDTPEKTDSQNTPPLTPSFHLALPEFLGNAYNTRPGDCLPQLEQPPREPAGQAPLVSHNDELCRPDGAIQPHWQPFLNAMTTMDADEVQRLQLDIRRLLRENGVTYHMHGDDTGGHRPWSLDLIPWILSPQDWERLEAGLTQRAMVLDLLLKDIYGPRMLLREKVIPAELVFSHSGFLRACDQVRHRGQRQLTFYSADLSRSETGEFLILRDLTQSTTGSGYALENRTVLSRVLPGVFRECQVERLSHFFRAMRDTLAGLAHQRRDNPRVVLLTPGPSHETYFEHAYLASYLGYTLVQGDDLTVRDGAVWLKSIGGLEPVDVVLRRVPDVLCDPLELDESSRFGVAGLQEAVRLKHVTVANPLGTGVLENPALSIVLDAVCQRFLGEPLSLHGPRTWWCGERSHLQYVLENLETLRIQPIVPLPGMPQNAAHHLGPVADGWTLAAAAREELRARIAATPSLFTAHAPPRLSTAPTLSETAMAPRPVALRSFLTAHDDAYLVMPGGLTRSIQDGVCEERRSGEEMSKDTWVRAHSLQTRQPHVSLWTSNDTLQQPWATDTVLPSLAAENLFWVGRHLERANASARLMRMLVSLFNHSDMFGPETEREGLVTLMHALAHLSGASLPAEQQNLIEWTEPKLHALALSPELGGAIPKTLFLLASNAYAVRDRWSTDTWRIINAIEEHASTLSSLYGMSDSSPETSGAFLPRGTLERLQATLDTLLTSLVAFTGYTMESMTRAAGWMLLDIGRRMERGLLLVHMLQSTLTERHSPPVNQQLMEMTLSTWESLITYRRRYRAHLRLEQTLDLLLLDETNPRGLAFQLEALRDHMQALPRTRRATRTSPEERLALEAYANLKRMDAQDLAVMSPRTHRNEALREFLSEQARLLAGMGAAISLSFFSHASGPTPLARRWETLA